ncbi:MAG: amidohydrolase [Planctomycetia bacterium]|nr:amidohydrolase [Planctomycetia bacterium]
MKSFSFVVPLLLMFAGTAQAAEDSAPAYTELLKIDVHSHVFDDVPALSDLLHRIRLRTVNVCVKGTQDYRRMHRIALDLYRKYPDLYPFTSTFDLLGRDQPDYAAKVVAELDETFRNGAVGVKIWKEVGMSIKRPDGSFILPDDPMFDPIYAHLARVGKPLHAHLAEPIDAWRKLDPDSVHYGYYAKHPEWHLYGQPDYPTHAELIAARDRIMEKHPRLIVVGAHLGSLEHDLDALAQTFERFPNFHIDTAARKPDLMRHPSDKVRGLFLKYADRILYGFDATWLPKETSTPADALAHVEKLRLGYEADYEYFAGRGILTHRGRQAEALSLPRSVLEKFYHGNAERVFKLEQAWNRKP